MNERIKELADEARIKFSAHWAHQGVDTAVITRLDLKEFAELIVRECIITIQMGITRDGPNTEKYLRSMKHIKQIKEHFGVEE
jgi:hypothetical protein